MNCDTFRESLRARFDAGAYSDCEADDHAKACATCAAYRDGLAGLNAAFAAMPLETPRATLARRVKMRLASEPTPSSEAPWWIPAAALCACAIVTGAALYFAIPIDPLVWWDYANQTAATPDWMVRDVSFAEDIALLQAYWLWISGLVAPFSGSMMWAAAFAAAILLAGLNGAEAYRLRTASNQTVRYQRWS